MIAALCLLSLAAAPAHFVWPKPGLIDEIAITDVIQADGVPVRLHSFRSSLGVQQLLQTYAAAFDQAGFYLALTQQRVTAEPHLTALDWRTKLSYSAILSPNKDGTTSCLLGEAALGKKRAPTAATDFAPLMPGARSVVRIDQEAHRLISFSVAGPVEAVHRFYLQALPAVGFAAAPAVEQANLYGKGLERIQVIAKSKGNGATSVVLMHRAVDRP